MFKNNPIRYWWFIKQIFIPDTALILIDTKARRLPKSQNRFPIPIRWVWLNGGRKFVRKPDCSFRRCQIRIRTNRRTPPWLLNYQKNVLHFLYFLIQWVQLNGITDNVFNRLMGSTLSRLTNPKFLFHVCYSTDNFNGISLSLSHSNTIKSSTVLTYYLLAEWLDFGPRWHIEIILFNGKTQKL
jgi:hypothetical protein